MDVTFGSLFKQGLFLTVTSKELKQMLQHYSQFFFAHVSEEAVMVCFFLNHFIKKLSIIKPFDSL